MPPNPRQLFNKTWYSKAAEVLGAFPPNTEKTPAEWRKILQNKQVKRTELDYVGQNAELANKFSWNDDQIKVPVTDMIGYFDLNSPTSLNLRPKQNWHGILPPGAKQARTAAMVEAREQRRSREAALLGRINQEHDQLFRDSIRIRYDDATNEWHTSYETPTGRRVTGAFESEDEMNNWLEQARTDYMDSRAPDREARLAAIPTVEMLADDLIRTGNFGATPTRVHYGNQQYQMQTPAGSNYREVTMHDPNANPPLHPVGHFSGAGDNLFAHERMKDVDPTEMALDTSQFPGPILFSEERQNDQVNAALRAGDRIKRELTRAGSSTNQGALKQMIETVGMPPAGWEGKKSEDWVTRARQHVAANNANTLPDISDIRAEYPYINIRQGAGVYGVDLIQHPSGPQGTLSLRYGGSPLMTGDPVYNTREEALRATQSQYPGYFFSDNTDHVARLNEWSQAQNSGQETPRFLNDQIDLYENSLRPVGPWGEDYHNKLLRQQLSDVANSQTPYSGIGGTTADTQIWRWSQERALSEIVGSKRPDGRYEVAGVVGGNEVRIGARLTPRELQEKLRLEGGLKPEQSKEVADAIIARLDATPEGQRATISTSDLPGGQVRIGGEAYRRGYDDETLGDVRKITGSEPVLFEGRQLNSSTGDPKATGAWAVPVPEALKENIRKTGWEVWMPPALATATGAGAYFGGGNNEAQAASPNIFRLRALTDQLKDVESRLSAEVSRAGSSGDVAPLTDLMLDAAILRKQIDDLRGSVPEGEVNKYLGADAMPLPLQEAQPEIDYDAMRGALSEEFNKVDMSNLKPHQMNKLLNMMDEDARNPPSAADMARDSWGMPEGWKPALATGAVGLGGALAGAKDANAADMQSHNAPQSGWSVPGPFMDRVRGAGQVIEDARDWGSEVAKDFLTSAASANTGGILDMMGRDPVADMGMSIAGYAPDEYPQAPSLMEAQQRAMGGNPESWASLAGSFAMPWGMGGGRGALASGERAAAVLEQQKKAKALAKITYQGATR